MRRQTRGNGDMTPETEHLRSEATRLLHAGLATLSPRYDLVIRLRYGLEGCPLKRREIAGQLEISIARVQQIEWKVLHRLRAFQSGALREALRTFMEMQ